MALSTDKASAPVNLYGATKLAADKLFVAANINSRDSQTTFSVVRYGNVMGSRGSVIPFFLSLKNNGEIPITDLEMTRFMITLEQAIDIVWKSFSDSLGGEIYVRKIPSMKVVEIAKAISPKSKIKIIGIRPGEKLHEQMIGPEDSNNTFEYDEYYKILPTISDFNKDINRIKNGVKVIDKFVYNSNTNPDWMTQNQLQQWLQSNTEKVFKSQE